MAGVGVGAARRRPADRVRVLPDRREHPAQLLLVERLLGPPGLRRAGQLRHRGGRPGFLALHLEQRPVRRGLAVLPGGRRGRPGVGAGGGGAPEASRNPAHGLLHPRHHLDHGCRHPFLVPLQPSDRSAQPGAQRGGAGIPQPRLARRPAHVHLVDHRDEPVAVHRLHRGSLRRRDPAHPSRAVRVGQGGRFGPPEDLLRHHDSPAAGDDHARRHPDPVRCVPGVQRGHGHDGRRPLQQQPGARDVAVPQRFPHRQHGLRLCDRHGHFLDHVLHLRCPDPDHPTTEGPMVTAGSVPAVRATPQRQHAVAPTSHRPRVGSAVGRWLTWLALAALAILVIYPLLWMVFSSFKDNGEVFAHPFGLPGQLRWQNFADAADAGVVRYFTNSVIVTATSILTTTLFSAWAAYGLVRLKIPFGGPVVMLLLGGLMLAPTVALVPLFGLLQQLHIYNTYWALIVLYTAFRIPFTTFLIRAYMIDLPADVDEAAVIDGAKRHQIFWRIILPMSMPIIVSAVILQILFAWNEF